MEIDFYCDVHAGTGFEKYGLFASTKPLGSPGGARRFRFTVDIPNDAFYGKVEYAPVIGSIEVDKKVEDE